MSISGGDDGRSSFADDPAAPQPQAWLRCKWPYISSDLQYRIENTFFEDGATIHFHRVLGGGSWLPSMLFPESRRVGAIVKQVLATAQGTHRRLTVEEVNAVSEVSAHAISTYTWTEPVAISAALAAVANGRKTFKFPFYQPKATWFDPNVFPSRKLPLFRGFKATANWHFLRFAAYYPVTVIASAVFFESVTTMMFGVGIQRDPRLTAVIRDTRAHLREQLGNKPLGASQPAPASGQDNYSGSQYPPVPQPQSYSQSQPVGNSTSSAPQLPQWNTAQAPVQEPRESTPSALPANNPNWDSDPFEDDSSPISPSARRAEAAAREQNSGGASSWARVREQAQSASGASGNFAKGDSSGREIGWAQLRQDKAPNTAEGPRGTEQFAYSKQDEERERGNYEKEQAQKEFDALLEAERRGESSTRGRR